ncbi:MAG TPA: condensation domain-containing protein, partial [Longimicrobiaceae bacterium]|nr:condensation domain-containing protein [Longimicrobiaceae bacterium]
MPPSFAQQRLWFIDQLDPGSAAYNLRFPLRLRGTLDVPVLRRALSAVVARHEALRTVFAAEGGEPVQVVRPPEPVPFPAVDLGRLAEERREAEAARLAGEEALRPFDLSRGPLLRATLLRLGDGDHAALFTMHHVVSDGWSMGVLVRELSALYHAFSRGEPSPLPELPVQYADYAVWQRERVSGEALEAQLAWWRERLAGAPPTLELPADRPRLPAGEAPAQTCLVELPPGLTRRLRELAQAEGATPFMALLAGFSLLLARYSGQDDVVVGSPIAGRTRSELEGLIGFFVNTLALRTDLSGDPSFRGLLRRVREATLGAFQHQDLPFERLVEELAPERSLTHAPLFQVMFALQNTEQSALRLGELRMEPLPPGEGVTQFDLDLSLQEGPERIVGTLRYRRDRFDAPTVERMLAHFRILLEAALAAPDRPVSGLPLLAGEERARVLEAWNATARAYPRGRCLHELVAEQAARTPDAPAVVFEGRVLVYAELDARADRLAHGLRLRGVGPEARVAIAVEKGFEMALAVLGVLKAGGAYVPLDPAYPPERLAWMLEDSGARVLLTQESLRQRLPEFAGEVCFVPTDGTPLPRPLPRKGGGENGTGPDNLAYVIYTSGSTGRPKGVAVQHRAVVNYAVDMAERLGLGP